MKSKQVKPQTKRSQARTARPEPAAPSRTGFTMDDIMEAANVLLPAVMKVGDAFHTMQMERRRLEAEVEAQQDKEDMDHHMERHAQAKAEQTRQLANIRLAEAVRMAIHSDSSGTPANLGLLPAALDFWDAAYFKPQAEPKAEKPTVDPAPGERN